MFINDTFVNEAYHLNKQKCHFSLSFLCSVKFTKQYVKLLFADLKFELFNIINPTLFSIITSGIYSVYESITIVL